MRPGALAEDVARAAWLPPAPAALLALARGNWEHIRRDPGAVTLLLGLPAAHHLPFSSTLANQLLQEPEILDAAVAHLRRDGEAALLLTVDYRRVPILDVALAYAHTASALAAKIAGCDCDQAWVCGLLAPLGWLAVAAHDPCEAAACLEDPAHADDAAQTERRRWGLDQSELTRRLAWHCTLPSWLRCVIGHLGLPPDVAERLGAARNLFRITQLAVVAVERSGRGLGLATGAEAGDLARSLDIPVPEAELPRTFHDGPLASPPGLTEILALHAENRRLHSSPALASLEKENDALHQVLTEQRGREDTRLHNKKLAALAEFAAGAGHEINNPLAVISGQAQYLLGHEQDEARKKALDTIIAQTHRIHSLLRDLMQFARPPAPQMRAVDLERLLDEVATSLGDFAQQQQVRIQLREENETGQAPLAPRPCHVEGDANQLKMALTNLIRNAIEAAGKEGWVRVRLVKHTQHVEVSIEDSGSGPNEQQRLHLFDPFYSGRSAGRGRGLGLPIAWSLVRQQGGSLYLASAEGETTRFVLTLPFPESCLKSLAS